MLSKVYLPLVGAVSCGQEVSVTDECGSALVLPFIILVIVPDAGDPRPKADRVLFRICYCATDERVVDRLPATSELFCKYIEAHSALLL